MTTTSLTVETYQSAGNPAHVVVFPDGGQYGDDLRRLVPTHEVPESLRNGEFGLDTPEGQALMRLWRNAH